MTPNKRLTISSTCSLEDVSGNFGENWGKWRELTHGRVLLNFVPNFPEWPRLTTMDRDSVSMVKSVVSPAKFEIEIPVCSFVLEKFFISL
jgi:hypothetical protein